MKALERLEKKKAVKKIHRALKEGEKLKVTALWFLKDTFTPRGNWEHLNSCAELFVSLFPIIEKWDWEVQGKFRPDRIAAIGGKKFYFEVDRGTEKSADILKKLNAYVEHWRETKEEFSVVFTVEDYQDPFGKMRTSARVRGNMIFDLFDQRGLPGNYYVAFHSTLSQNPFASMVSRFKQFSLKEVLTAV